MKIIFENEFESLLSNLVTISLDIIIRKIKAKTLNKDDYDMILEHLQSYKDLILEAQNGKDN